MYPAIVGSPHMRTTYGRSVFSSRNKLLVAGRRTRAVAQELRTIGIIASLVRVLIMYVYVGWILQSGTFRKTPRHLQAPVCTRQLLWQPTHREEKKRRRGEEEREGKGEGKEEEKKKEGKKDDFRRGRKIVQRHNGAYTRCAP